MIRSQRIEINKLIEENHISKEILINYLTELYKVEDAEEILNTPEIINTNNNVEIKTQEVQLTLQTLEQRQGF